jgi:hypothetical protein
MKAALRPELEPLPARMKNLEIDDRGYPVPWFVDWLDGKPEFRAMDPKKWNHAVRFKRCWVCGELLGRFLAFVVGPMCGMNRTTSEPPCHLDCARWSARNCLFLANPEAIRRVDDTIPLISENTAGIGITRNPGVALLWITKEYDLFDDGKGKPLICMGDPESVEWYCEGKPATREQVVKSIEGGIPRLMALAMQQEGAVAELQRQRSEFEKYLPEAVA